MNEADYTKRPPTTEEAIERLSVDRLARYVPKHRAAWFVQAVHNAVRIYLDLQSPEELRRELLELEQHLKQPSADTARAVAALSDGAKAYLEHVGAPIDPTEFAKAESRERACEQLLAHLTASGSWAHEPGQGRWRMQTVGALKRGRPVMARENILVALLAAAYGGATGRPVTRGSRKKLNEFETLVDDVLVAMLRDDRFSVRKLVRKQIETRDALLRDFANDRKIMK